MAGSTKIPQCPGHLWSKAVDGSDPGWRECLFCKRRERVEAVDE
jgi:hypothetical protein